MRAYDLAMTLVFVNCAFPIIDAMGINTILYSNGTDIFMQIYRLFSNPIFTIAGISVSGIEALAVGLAAATIVVLMSNPVTDRGIAMTVFAGIFWVSFGMSSVIIMGIMSHFAGFGVFYMIFMLASTFIFINAMVQFPTGGQWGHV